MAVREYMTCFTGNDWDYVQGPAEYVSVNSSLPTDVWAALSHMDSLYALLMDKLPNLVNPLYPTLLDIPRDGLLSPIEGSRGIVTNIGSVTVRFSMGNYILTLDYYYTSYVGLYYCYAHTNSRYHTRIMSVRHIRGVGSCLSALEMVMNYASLHAQRYRQCSSCKYSSTDGEYCGKGLIMGTGECGQYLPIDN